MGSMEVFHKMKIPNKIGVLLRHLMKEVVQNQPNDIYEFSAECIDNIIKKGENTLFDGTLGTGDEDVSTVGSTSRIRALMEETPVVPMAESDELAECSAEEMGNSGDDGASKPFLKVEISAITPSLEAPDIEPLDLGDLKSDLAEAPTDITEGDDGKMNQESLVEETSMDNEAGYQADESLNLIDETVDTTEKSETIEEAAVEGVPAKKDQPNKTEETSEIPSEDIEKTAKEDAEAEAFVEKAPAETFIGEISKDQSEDKPAIDEVQQEETLEMPPENTEKSAKEEAEAEAHVEETPADALTGEIVIMQNVDKLSIEAVQQEEVTEGPSEHVEKNGREDAQAEAPVEKTPADALTGEIVKEQNVDKLSIEAVQQEETLEMPPENTEKTAKEEAEAEAQVEETPADALTGEIVKEQNVDKLAIEEVQQEEVTEGPSEDEERNGKEDAQVEAAVEETPVDSLTGEDAKEQNSNEEVTDVPLEEQTKKEILREEHPKKETTRNQPAEVVGEDQLAQEAASEDQSTQEEMAEQKEDGIQNTVEPVEVNLIEEAVKGSANVLADQKSAATEAADEEKNKEAQEEPVKYAAVTEEQPVAKTIESNKEAETIRDEPIIDDETPVEDEEQIWNQLQRDIEQEEVNQQEQAALRIQSTYRGYRVRKSIKNSDGENNEETGDDEKSGLEHDGIEEVDTVGSMTVDKAARPPLSRTTSVTLPEDDRLREELLAEERMDSVEIVETYVINIQDPDENTSCKTKQNEDEELSEPETFELHIKSDETNKDGLVEGSWYDNDLSRGEEGYPSHYLEDISESDEHVLAAIRIQSGYRGYRERKRYSEKRMKVVQRDIDDDEMERAALKIQAGYRGYATRKRISGERGAREIMPDVVTDEEEIIYGDDHAAAALAIQNSFRNKMRMRQKESSSLENTPRNGQFLSVGPSHLQEDEDLNNAAIKIQSNYRGYITRKQAKKEKEAATRIQAGYRGYSARKQIKSSEKYLAVPQIDQEELNMAAAKIQANYRGYATRKQLKRRKDLEGEAGYVIPLDDHELNQTAAKSQANYRGNAVRKQMKTRKDLEERGNYVMSLDDVELNQTAAKIQANYRGNAVRKQMRIHKDQEKRGNYVMPLDDVEMNQAAAQIQANYRGYATRKQLKKRKDLAEEEHYVMSVDGDEMNQAATKIQANYRGYVTRKQLKKAHQSYEEPEEIIIGDDSSDYTTSKIQANHSCYTTRRQLNSERGEHSIVEDDLNEDEKAAIKIQSTYRGYATRKRLNKPHHHQTPVHTNKSAQVYEKMYDNDDVLAATKIQANYRGNRARRKLADEKSEGSLTVTQMPEEEGALQNGAEDFNYGEDHENAAIKVQACYRGYNTRKKLKK